MKKIPLHSLVIMVGPSGSGKTYICNKKFDKFEIVSFDNIKDQLVGDFNRHDVNNHAWEFVLNLAKAKLDLGERVVIDASHINKNDRLRSVNIGKELGVPVFYLVVNRSVDEKVKSGDWRNNYPNLIQRQEDLFNQNIRDIMWGDGLAEVIDTRLGDFSVVKKINRKEFLTDIKSRGFNGVSIVGDIHGQFESANSAIDWARRRNHFLVFLGDIIDYGPKNLETIDAVYNCITRGFGVNIIGNHELKISKWFTQKEDGNITVRLSDGNKITIAQIEKLPKAEQLKWKTKFSAIMGLGANHWVMDNFIFAHGGVTNSLETIFESKLSGKLGKFAMFGELDSDMPFDNETGLPNRTYKWIDLIRKDLIAIVGHDIRSTESPHQVKNKQGGEVVFLDTGSGKGGYLTVADIPFKDMKITNFYRC